MDFIFAFLGLMSHILPVFDEKCLPAWFKFSEVNILSVVTTRKKAYVTKFFLLIVSIAEKIAPVQKYL